MKRRFIAVLLCCCLFPLAAESKADFRLSAEGGIIGGTSAEYAYENNEVMSRLDWKDTAIPVLSITADLDIKGLYLNARVDTAVPAASGIMEDYDFLLPQRWRPSHYSQHDSYADKYFNAAINLGYHFRIAKETGWTVSDGASEGFFIPSLGFAYRNRKWTARDGFLQYPPNGGYWTTDDPRQRVTGPVISYEQALFFFYVTLDLGLVFRDITGRDLIGISMACSLYPVIQGETIDNHLVRNIEFYDTVSNSDLGTKFYCIVSLFPDRRLSFFCRAGYEIFELEGKTASRSTGTDSGPLMVDEGYGSGIKIQQYFFSLGVNLKVL